MPTAFATADDVRIFLNTDIMEVENYSDTTEQQEAVNLIVSRLYGRIPSATINAWTLPSGVPMLIRSIAGRLVAATIYVRQATGDDQEVDPYARMLYQTAINMIDGILTGRLVMPELADADVDIDNSGHLEDAMYNTNINAPMFVEYTEY